MIVKINHTVVHANLLIADDGICQVFELGKDHATTINNVKQILILSDDVEDGNKYQRK
jgi:hypothetical protein